MVSRDTLTARTPERQREIEAWRDRGGVDLSHLRSEPEEQYLALGSVRMGVYETGNRYRFVCPICGRKETNDQMMSPACTGPSWTDDHPMEPMIRVDD